MLLKDISALLPNNLSKITANNLLMGDTKLFLLLRWMVKILDYPSTRNSKHISKDSIKGLTGHGPQRRRENATNESRISRKHAGEDPARLKNPETSEYMGPMSIKGVDLVKTLKDIHVSKGKPPRSSWSNANPEKSSQIWSMSLIEVKDENIKV